MKTSAYSWRSCSPHHFWDLWRIRIFQQSLCCGVRPCDPGAAERDWISQISSGKLKGVMTLQLLTLLRCDAINVECDLIALMQDLSEVMALTPPNLSGVGFGLGKTTLQLYMDGVRWAWDNYLCRSRSKSPIPYSWPPSPKLHTSELHYDWKGSLRSGMR